MTRMDFISFSDLSSFQILSFFSAAISAGFHPTTSNAQQIMTPNHPPPVTEGPDTLITFKLHEYLHPLRLDIDLSQDISPYMGTLPDELATSPSLPANMILV
ncbi:hypothetical protein EDD85DRAFT_940055 [Armillaria nabsnona]|nr:hypothetical protein EDD85DRAFT_940055 [Armillaria nabsnona]